MQKITHNNQSCMNHYDKLKSEYYRQFPDELKLELGCEVKIVEGSRFHDFMVEHYGTRFVYNGKMLENTYSCVSTLEMFGKEKDNFKLLGKDIDIREVLRLLKPYTLDTAGNLCPAMVGASGFHYKPKYNGLRFDLTLPLKDQPDVCKKLCELLDVKN